MAIKKIILIQPSITMPEGSIKRLPTPMGLLYLGSFLKERGYDIKIMDSPCLGFNNEIVKEGKVTYGLSDEDVIKKIKEFNPDIIGVTNLFSSQKNAAIHHCELARKASNAKIVLGGIHPSLDPEDSIKNNSVDYVIIGEGEYRFLELIKAIENNKEPAFDGVVYKKNGEVIIKPRTTRIENLDELPLPARELVDMEKYIQLGLLISPFTRRERAEQMMTSRGCPFDCIFCPSVQFWGHQVKTRSVDNVIKEVDELVNKYKIEELQFFDDNLTVNKERAKEIFRRLIPYKLAWCTPNGLMAQTIDDEMIDLMAKSGAYQLSFAIESGNERVRREIIKKIVPGKEQIKHIIDKCHKYGIQVHGFFVIGFPGEKKEEIDETLKYPYETGFDSVSIYTASPMLGSRLYYECKKKGYLNEETALGDIKKGEIIIPEDSPEFVMSAEELSYLVEKSTREFNEYVKNRNPDAWRKKFSVFLKKYPEQADKILGRAT